MSDTDSNIADRYCRAFLSPANRARATHELAAHGAAALPVLQSILSGEARNEFGIAYRRLGMPVDCALVTIQLLRTTARPLEDLVRAEVAAGHRYAEDALRAIMAADLPSS
ncbi:MAG TPA: hypothetical protein VM847_19550 [Tahibacter sp.]|jgi:hypothetical protein|nr:hypothetical protein [Tahibacter sp.]